MFVVRDGVVWFVLFAVVLLLWRVCCVVCVAVLGCSLLCLCLLVCCDVVCCVGLCC